MHKPCFLAAALIICSLSLANADLHAQSSLTKKGLNGALFDIYSSFEPDEIVENFGGRIGYSIGGILDVGMVFSVRYDEVEGKNLSENNIGLRYGIMLLKQEDLAPLSLEISGAYGYSFIHSNYFENQDQQKEGNGYKLDLKLMRDFATGEKSMLRLGALGRFRSYSYTIQDISPATEETREFSPERETRYFFGLILSFARRTAQGRTYYFNIEPLSDDELNYQAAVRTGLVIEIR